MSVTIKDIARFVGVSHTTVSRALNDSPLINEETKERIRAAAEQMGYSPNFNAKSLVLDRSYNLGLFFTTLSQGTSASFFYEAIRGVNSVIQDRYQLVVKGIDDYTNFHRITRRHFDGLIIVSQSDDDQKLIHYAAEQSIPLVVLNRPVDTAGVLNVLSDEEQGAFHAASYLIQQGHRRIALIEGRAEFKSAQNRKEGFERAMRKYGLADRPNYKYPGKYDLESGHQAMRQFLDLEERPTAVFCCNDQMALGAMRAVAEAGLRVPDDISILGFDDAEFAAYVTPALTTVRRPIELISQEGARQLIRMIESKQAAGDAMFLKTELMIRESVRPL